MSEITVTFRGAHDAMQTQQALQDRSADLHRRLGRMRRPSFEADTVQAAVSATDRALAALVEALYPIEPPQPDWAMADDLALGDHHVGVGR